MHKHYGPIVASRVGCDPNRMANLLAQSDATAEAARVAAQSDAARREQQQQQKQKPQEAVRPADLAIGRKVLNTEAGIFPMDPLIDFGFKIAHIREPEFLNYASFHRLQRWGHDDVRRFYDSFITSDQYNADISTNPAQATLTGFMFDRSRITRQVILSPDLETYEGLPFFRQVTPEEDNARNILDNQLYLSVGTLVVPKGGKDELKAMTNEFQNVEQLHRPIPPDDLFLGPLQINH